MDICIYIDTYTLEFHRQLAKIIEYNYSPRPVPGYCL